MEREKFCREMTDDRQGMKIVTNGFRGRGPAEKALLPRPFETVPFDRSERGKSPQLKSPRLQLNCVGLQRELLAYYEISLPLRREPPRQREIEAAAILANVGKTCKEKGEDSWYHAYAWLAVRVVRWLAGSQLPG